MSFLFILPAISWAETEIKEISMTPSQVMQLAGALVDKGDFEHATQLLTKTPQTGVLPLEIERWFLMGQIAQKQGDYDQAIEIYRKLLDSFPDLSRVRFELAVCYMHSEKWQRADYHLRLAMADDELPTSVKNLMNYYRYIIRQNKNWNVWFNFGAAPDNNVNNAVGGTECIEFMGTLWCNELVDPVSAVGLNLTLGGSYEFKLSDQWRWKSDANVYTNVYDKHDYDDLYISASTGPRFVWERGDVWLAGIAARRWYGWNEYNWSAGVRLDTNYDFTNKLSGGFYLRFMNNTYDEYGNYLDGQTYSANSKLFYSLNSNVYVSFSAGLQREETVNPIYSYWQPVSSIGIGAELPWGFHVYFEPAVHWTLYDDERFAVKDNEYVKIVEKDFTHMYSLALSNNKFDLWGFVPTLMFNYTRRDSNIWQREFDKFSISFSMQQRF